MREPTLPDDEELLEQLRAQLLSNERRRLARLEAQLDPSQVAARLADHLPRAVKLCTEKDQKLSWALQPALESAIRETVRKRREELADAIYPIIGPSISRALKKIIAEMLQRLNEVLSRRFSIESIRWRLEAKRTGRPFTEVALLRTLVYRVERVLWIDRASGLLLCHVTSFDVPDEEPARLSALLAALNAFSREALGARQGLERLEVGDRSVWIESSSRTLIAAVVRGNPPVAFSDTLRGALEQSQLELAEALDAFEGDVAPFERARPLLAECLKQETLAPSHRRAQRLGVALLAVLWLLVGGVMVWLVASVRSFERSVAALRAEPGLVVISAKRRWGADRVEGLRDPLARSPEAVLRAHGVDPGDIETRFEPYQSLEPLLVARRSAARLEQLVEPFPPQGTEISPRFALEAAEAARAFFAAADQAGLRASLIVRGSSDDAGPPELNASLAWDRAEGARQALLAEGLPPDRIVAQPDPDGGRREVRLEPKWEGAP